MAKKRTPQKRTPPKLESGSGSSGGAPRKPSRRKASEPRLMGLRNALLTIMKWGTILGTVFACWIFFTLPNIDNLNSFDKKPSVLVKAENGQIIGSYGDIYGDYIPFEELPASLIDSILATEDRNFFSHLGIDPLGLARAMYVNIRAGHVVQGGSTITQQVAKNVFLTPERSLMRKLREMFLAFKLEWRFSKKEIMSIYVNRVYLGSGSYGIDAAAKRYFDKSARELTLSESAIIAGLLKAPSRFAPTSNPERSRNRAEQVLRNMHAAGYLSEGQTEHAISALESTMQNRNKSPQSSWYFADWVMDQLPNYVGNLEQDVIVTTTLNPEWQVFAQEAIDTVLTDEKATELETSQAALVSMDNDGAVRAMIGGRNYAESQYNRATQSLRQPGSSFKLFVYLAGLEWGFTPDTIVDDAPISIPVHRGTWTPKNYAGKYEGPIPLRQAVANSINTVAVIVSQETGIERVIDVARRLGVSAAMDPVPSLALGSTEVSLLEMTGAYAHLAANGQIVEPYGIVQIETTDENKKILYHHQPPFSGVVLRTSVVGMMNEMLMGVVDHGTGAGARIGRPAAGKTGTTSDYKDAWFIGYTPQLITGVWVGNDDNRPMKRVTGGKLPAPIWREYMSKAMAGLPVQSIPISNIPEPLPWQEDLTPNQDAVKSDGVHLGDGFWDKLFR